MRHIEHPGPPGTQRWLAVECGISPVLVELPVGKTLLNALAAVLEQHGASSAVASLSGGAFAPFNYVMPALSSSPDHVAYFSATHSLPEVFLDHARVTLGRREGSAWLHCHGIWRDATGGRLGGHILPNDAEISRPICARIWLLEGAQFRVRPNPETNFSLFEAVAHGEAAAPAGSNALALTLRPNVDLCIAVEQICTELGIRSASIRGGVGSLNGVDFDDGRRVVPFVTEVMIVDGTVDTGPDGRARCRIRAAMVDQTGALNEGYLQHGANPVLVTFELAIERTTPQANTRNTVQ